MAIIPSMFGLGAWVVVNGSPAKEYEDPNEAEDLQNLDRQHYDLPPTFFPATFPIPHVIKYIEAIPGAEFALRLHVAPHYQPRAHHLGVSSEIHGTGDYIRTQIKHMFPGEHVYLSADIVTGNPQTGFKKNLFMFTALDIVDNDTASLHQEFPSSGQYGVLRVLVFNMNISQAYVLTGVPNNLPEPKFKTALSETALKGMTIDTAPAFKSQSMISFEPTLQYLNDFQDPLRRPIAIFEFRYRTKEGLYKEGVSPRPATIEAEVAQMTNREVRQKLAEYMAKERANVILVEPAAVKKEDSSGLAGVKREGSPAVLGKHKARRLQDGRVQVDLTEDASCVD
ncbi:hypothetical protein QBC35DRAFT_456863 [Podospora australis]|uniref:DUF7918 domain-containing protein n=1 Tax=Podospora australis TaxID=1536484 RepID=A0AAN7AEG5_9PEZI|nr:hypothetical protein QBC35DRAFT_456863 [Podospora australis]